jgi:hypothetical protein
MIWLLWWRYENPPMGGGNRSIENHYPTRWISQKFLRKPLRKWRSATGR